MSSAELIESLQRAADEKIRLIWQEAEGEAEITRSGVYRKIDEMRRQYTEMQSSAAGEENEMVLSEAANRARMIRLSAEREIEKRLFSLALASLPSLRRDGSYREKFAALVAELPPLPWDKARVNPQDATLAGEYLPGAEILADDNIMGGMEVSSEKGKIRVINTLEKRLALKWSSMVPEMMKDIHATISR